MKICAVLATLALSASLSPGLLRAAGPAPAPQPRVMRALRNQSQGTLTFDNLTKHVQLSDDQKTKLKALCDDLDAQLKDWQDDFDTLMHGVTGPDGWSKIGKDMAAMHEDRQKILETFDTQVNALLTPDQRIDWEATQLLQAFNQRYGLGTKLTADQKTQLEKLCKDAAKQILALKDPKDPAGRAPIIGQLWKQIVATVFTDEQAGQALAPWMITPGPTLDDETIMLMPRPGGAGPAGVVPELRRLIIQLDGMNGGGGPAPADPPTPKK